MGRCGSTILFDFVYGYYAENCEDFHKPDKKFLPVISERNDSGKTEVWKTHDRNVPDILTSDLKFVYQYGNLFDILLSTTQSPLLAKNIHISKHLGVDASWVGTYKWVEQDVLKLEEHFNNWTKPIGCPILLIKYEDIWDNLDKICDYFEIPRNYASNFPAKRKRRYDSSDMPQKLREDLMKTYGNLYERIESLRGVREL